MLRHIPPAATRRVTRAAIAKSHDHESAIPFPFWDGPSDELGGRNALQSLILVSPSTGGTELKRVLSDRLVFGQRMLALPEHLPAFAQ